MVFAGEEMANVVSPGNGRTMTAGALCGFFIQRERVACHQFCM
jgi:hypothetical protein